MHNIGIIRRISKVFQRKKLKFQVDQIRKYRPYVVVGHDEKGEYSHGQHILNTHLLKDAILKANDSLFETDNNYEPWEISKLYLHLEVVLLFP